MSLKMPHILSPCDNKIVVGYINYIVKAKKISK
jgi:hypothetical protein